MKLSVSDRIRAAHYQDMARIDAAVARAFFNKGESRIAQDYQRDAAASYHMARCLMGLEG